MKSISPDVFNANLKEQIENRLASNESLFAEYPVELQEMHYKREIKDLMNTLQRCAEMREPDQVDIWMERIERLVARIKEYKACLETLNIPTYVLK